MNIKKILSLILSILILTTLLTPSILATDKAGYSESAPVSFGNFVVDKTYLQAEINRGDYITQNDTFTDESMEEYRTAYAYAVLVLHYGQIQSEIDEAQAGLEAAIDNLIPVTTIPDGIYISGDTDLDKRVTVKDATIIQKYIVNLVEISDEYFFIMDVNCDDKVNIKDVTEIQKYVASLPTSGKIGFEVVPDEETRPDTSEESTYQTDETDRTESTTAAVVTEPTTVTDATDPDVTISTDPEESTFLDPEKGEIRFKLLEEGRIMSYGNGSGDSELYLATSVESAKAALSRVDVDLLSGTYLKPTLSAEHDDEYFESKALIVSLNCVGGSGCTQSIDSITVCDGIITVHRTIQRPYIYPADMNYQYVLLEVNKEDIEGITDIREQVTYCYVGDDPYFTEPTTVPATDESVTIYFSNSGFWSDVRIHFWGGASSTEWPGKEMEFVERNVYGEDVYKYTIPANTVGVVFNSAIDKTQTVDVVTTFKNNLGVYAVALESGKWTVGYYEYIYLPPTSAVDEELIDAINRLYDWIVLAENSAPDGDNFTDESRNTLWNEINEAYALLEKENVTVEEIEAQIQALKDAINGLEKPDIDTEELWEVIERSIAISDNCTFTDESYDAFSTAYTYAYIAGLYGQTQDEVDNAKANLETAIKGLVPIDFSGGRAIDFNKAEEGRIMSYSNGSCDSELYLATSVESAKAALSRVDVDELDSFYLNPTLSAKYDDEYFEENALVIFLSCVGGSCCEQDVFSLTAEDNTLVINRMLTEPALQLCDMNYQYVLMEISKADISSVTELRIYNVYNYLDEY